MIRKDAKLSKQLFSKTIEQLPTRDGYGQGVVEAAKKDKRIVVVCADLTESTRSMEFKKAFPERFIQIGVQEQLLASLSAGLAAAGKVPFITSYAMFCPGRCWEQIHTNICLNDMNVKIIGSHAGVSVGPDGATHQGIEDIAILRPVPNITILAPCDAIEAKKATLAIAKTGGPCYVRFAREKSPVFTTDKTPFKIGKALTLRDGNDVAIIACGPLVYHALEAAELLAKQGIEARVINSPSIKPLDQAAVLKAAKECRAIVTVEEHQITGGLGGAVSEYLAKTQPTPMSFVGVPNRFGESGEPEQLIKKFGMDPPAIAKAAKDVLRRKQA